MQIIYKISSGTAPFVASLTPSVGYTQTWYALGEYSFDDIPENTYVLRVEDSRHCYKEIIVSPTTTTTTIIPDTTTTSTTEEPIPDTTTTTTTGGTTTTTTTIPAISCNTPYTFNQLGINYPAEIAVALGASTGFVVLDYDSTSVPDKFIVEFDGSEVINTGYISSFFGDSVTETNLNNCLALIPAPPATLDGMGQGCAYFPKGTATEYINIKVYAPCEGTFWKLTVSCPSETLPTRVWQSTMSTIYDTSASVDAKMFVDAGATITEKGVCWSTVSISPTIAGDHVASGDTTDAPYTVVLTPLLSDTLYYVRLYVTNDAVTTYSVYFLIHTLASTTTTTTTIP